LVAATSLFSKREESFQDKKNVLKREISIFPPRNFDEAQLTLDLTFFFVRS
jgi:hypothetical protein